MSSNVVSMKGKVNKKRSPLKKSVQIKIFRRDGWLCCWCKKPVIFAPVMKYLDAELTASGDKNARAYYHAHWTRDGSPLLDELGAVIDHIEPLANHGKNSEDNLCTACNKCNAQKGSGSADTMTKRSARRKPVKGKHGEPKWWDGLSLVFVMLAQKHASGLIPVDKQWLKALRDQ